MATKLKIEKGWMKKKSSPLKLLSQSQPNFAEMTDTFLEENHPMTISSKFCSY
jgi:hypothetical protein